MIYNYENIREIVEHSSVLYSDRIAFRVKHKNGKDFYYDDITYLRMRKEVEALSTYFLDNDYNNKKIVITGKNSYEWMVVFLASLCVNSVIVPIDRMLPENEFSDQLIRADGSVVFHDNTFDKFFEANPKYNHINTESAGFSLLLKGNASDEYKNIVIDNKKTSILLFTSGTTSQSKAVMLSQKNITSNIYAMSVWEKFEATDVNMALLPFHHTFGMTQMVLFLSYGMCNVFCEGLRLAKCLNEYHVSMLVCVPRIADEIKNTIYSKLKIKNKLGTVKFALKVTSILKRLGIDVRRKIFKEIHKGLGGSLRMMIVGAAAASPEILDFFNGIGVLTVQGYGLTETSPCIAAENHTHRRENSVGCPIPGVDVKIVNPDENGIGEIAVKGENVMNGYYQNDEANESVFHDGYFYTGDMGYLDKDNYLFITGRKKNVIVLSNGKNIFPEELEALICECEAVRECLVFTSPDNSNILSAKIVYKRDLDMEFAKKEIDEHMKNINNKVVHYKQIRNYEITDIEFEKTTTLKIKR